MGRPHPEEPAVKLGRWDLTTTYTPSHSGSLKDSPSTPHVKSDTHVEEPEITVDPQPLFWRQNPTSTAGRREESLKAGT